METITVEEAQRRIFEASEILPKEQIFLSDTSDVLLRGRILAEDIKAKITQPPFPRSAMDGYAVRAENTAGASRENPVCLPVEKEVDAGDAPVSLTEGHAIRIMTGAPIPEGADLVIPQEMTNYGEQTVEIYRSLSAGTNCVPAGEDFRQGDTIAEKGSCVDAYTAASAAASGADRITVRRKIRVIILTTGSELTLPGEILEPGKIYNSSLTFFRSRCAELNCEIIRAVQVEDNIEAIAREIEKGAPEADLILTTGGVSVGKKDYLPEVMDRIGAAILFHGIDVKPGSPTMASKLGKATILSLSGNPFSAAAMFELLFAYYEKKALQRTNLRIFRAMLPASSGYPKKTKRRRFIRGVIGQDGVYIPAGQKNGQLQAGIGSNCLVEIAPGNEGIAPGEAVKVWIIEFR